MNARPKTARYKIMRPIIIDHDDSFTHILAQYFAEITGEMPTILNHKEACSEKEFLEKIRTLDPSHIVLSPGPGTVENPDDFAIGHKILQEFANPEKASQQIPILGVCLGHQGIAAHFGAKIIHASEPVHGKTSQITLHSTDKTTKPANYHNLFQNIPSPLTAMRYHSLIINPSSLPSDLEITASIKEEANEDEIIMAIQHKTLPIFGVQFHPESIGTKHGLQLIKNFLTS
jgi:anthranilate synthase/aminodeoxychorismate synthase-like glutamine amidotransferase